MPHCTVVLPGSPDLFHLYLFLCPSNFPRPTPTPPWQSWDITIFWKLSWARFGASALCSPHTHIPLPSTYHIILQMTLYGFLSTLDYMRLKRGIICLFIPLSQGLIQCRCSTDDSRTNQSCNKLIIPLCAINFVTILINAFYLKQNKLRYFGWRENTSTMPQPSF